MKVFEFAGIIFNADNICTIQKVTMKSENKKTETNDEAFETIPGIQIVTTAGGVNFTFVTVKERDEKFSSLLHGLEKL